MSTGYLILLFFMLTLHSANMLNYFLDGFWYSLWGFLYISKFRSSLNSDKLTSFSTILDIFCSFVLLNCSGQAFHQCVESKWQKGAGLPYFRPYRDCLQLFPFQRLVRYWLTFCVEVCFFFFFLDLFLLLFIYWKGGYTERRDREEDAGAGSQSFGPSSTAFLGHRQGAGWEAGLPG